MESSPKVGGEEWVLIGGECSIRPFSQYHLLNSTTASWAAVYVEWVAVM